MSDKDDDLDDMDLGDDFGFDDMESEFGNDMSGDLGDLNTGSRTPVSGAVVDTTRGFIDGITDDKLGSVLEVAKAAIPSSLSAETAVVAESYATLSDEVSKQGNKLRREARRTLKTFKRVLPEGGLLSRVADKAMSALGDSEGVSGTAEPTTAERALAEVSRMMGEKSDAEAEHQQYKEQLEFIRQKDVRDIQATQALDTERMRKFHFEVSDKYYRASIDIAARQLYTMEELLSVTKAGFDVFKHSLTAITENTMLPEAVKVRNSELVTMKLKEAGLQAMSGALFGNSNPIAAMTKKLSGGVRNYAESALGVMESAAGGVESIAGLTEGGMSLTNTAGMLASDIAKSALGKALGRALEGTDAGKDVVWNAKNAAADPKEALKKLSDGDGPVAWLAGVAASSMGSGTSNFTVDKVDPNAATHLSNRTVDSINKVIPQLLSKIHSEVKTSRELQLLGMDNKSSVKARRLGKPEDNELVYDPRTEGFVTKKELRSNIKEATSVGIEANISNPADQVVRLLTDGDKVELTKSEFKAVRKAVIDTVLTKGAASAEIFTNPYFKNIIKNESPELWSKVVGSNQRMKSRMGKDSDLQTSMISLLSAIKTTKSAHTKVAQDLVDRGMSKEAVDAGLLTRSNDGGLIGDRKATLADLIDKGSNAKISEAPEVKESLKDQFEGLTIKEKLLKGIELTKEDVERKASAADEPTNSEVASAATKGSFDEGGYTKDGGKKQVAGVVHKGEYVIPQDDLDKLISATTEGDDGVVKELLSKIVTTVTTQSDKYDISTDKLIAAIGDAGTRGKGAVLEQLDRIPGVSVGDTTNKIKSMVNSTTGAAKGIVSGMFTDADNKTIDKVAEAVASADGLIAKTSALFSMDTFKSATDILKNTAGRISEAVTSRLPSMDTVTATINKHAPDSVINGYKKAASAVSTAKAATEGKLSELGIGVSEEATVTARSAAVLDRLRGGAEYDTLVTGVEEVMTGGNPKGPKYIKVASREYAVKIAEYLKDNPADEKYPATKLMDIVGGTVLGNLKRTAGKGVVAAKENTVKILEAVKTTATRVTTDLTNKVGATKAAKYLASATTNKVDTRTSAIGKRLKTTSNNDYVLLVDGVDAVLAGEDPTGPKYIKVASREYGDKITTYLDRNPGYASDTTEDLMGAVEQTVLSSLQRSALSGVDSVKSNTSAILDTISSNIGKVADTASEAVDLTKASLVGNRLKATSNNDYMLLVDSVEAVLDGEDPMGPEYINTAARVYAKHIQNYITTNPDRSEQPTEELMDVVESSITASIANGISGVTKPTYAKAKDLVDAVKSGDVGKIAEATGAKAAMSKVDEVAVELGGVDTEGVDYVLKWDGLSPAEQDALRLEFFSSVEYKSGEVTNFIVWLSKGKQVDPGSLNTAKGIISMRFSGIKDKLMGKFTKLRDELITEAIARATGTALKELSLKEEEVMRAKFYKSNEYQQKHVTDFDDWLKVLGMRRNGTGVIGRLKNSLKLSTIFRKTRKLDRMLMGGLAKGAIKTPYLLAKYGLKGAAAGTMAIGRGGINLGRRAVGLNKLAETPKKFLGNSTVPGMVAGAAGGAALGIGGALGRGLYGGLKGAGGLIAEAVGDTITAIPGLGILSNSKRGGAFQTMREAKDRILGKSRFGENNSKRFSKLKPDIDALIEEYTYDMSDKDLKNLYKAIMADVKAKGFSNKRTIRLAKQHAKHVRKNGSDTSPTKTESIKNAAKAAKDKVVQGKDKLLSYFKKKDVEEDKEEELDAKKEKKEKKRRSFLSMFTRSDKSGKDKDKKGGV
ncbi:MAG: hypothetical protein Q9M11_03470, partial [Mariprofundaceae bacterium]|nr:hypothetical protein [Mariprofundaceae bacterium]